jgi:hypothetical protein
MCNLLAIVKNEHISTSLTIEVEQNAEKQDIEIEDIIDSMRLFGRYFYFYIHLVLTIHVSSTMRLFETREDNNDYQPNMRHHDHILYS